jgi:hypothetical protein
MLLAAVAVMALAAVKWLELHYSRVELTTANHFPPVIFLIFLGAYLVGTARLIRFLVWPQGSGQALRVKVSSFREFARMATIGLSLTLLHFLPLMAGMHWPVEPQTSAKPSRHALRVLEHRWVQEGGAVQWSVLRTTSWRGGEMELFRTRTPDFDGFAPGDTVEICMVPDRFGRLRILEVRSVIRKQS